MCFKSLQVGRKLYGGYIHGVEDSFMGIVSIYTAYVYMEREPERERGGKNDVIIRLVLEGIT